MAPPLHRHQLVRLDDAGWRELQGRPWDDEARACLAHWQAQRLPLVVTRQETRQVTWQVTWQVTQQVMQPVPCPGDGPAADGLALGLPAPLCWQRRRIAMVVSHRHVAGFDEFPGIDAVVSRLPTQRRGPLRWLGAALAEVGASPHVYGSHGWQCLTGLAYVHAASDFDLWTAVADTAQADAVAAVMGAFAADHTPRLDGELVFPDGRAVAWREWRAWRAGRCRAVLMKSLAGASLVSAAW